MFRLTSVALSGIRDMPTFGSKSRFAVELSVNESHGGSWLFGRLCFWVSGSMVGDFELGASLRDALFQIEHILHGRQRRSNPSLMPLPATEVAAMLDDGLFLGNNPSTEEVAVREEWWRHNVTPPLDVFSGWKIFLVESEASARLIVQHPDRSVTERSLDVGEVDQILAETQMALTELYEPERE